MHLVSLRMNNVRRLSLSFRILLGENKKNERDLICGHVRHVRRFKSMREEHWGDKSPYVEKAANPSRDNLHPCLWRGCIYRRWLPLAARSLSGKNVKNQRTQRECLHAPFQPARQLHAQKATGKAKCDMKFGVRIGSGLAPRFAINELICCGNITMISCLSCLLFFVHGNNDCRWRI